MKSKLTKNQFKEFKKNIKFEGKNRIITVVVRYDDKCGNGHNTFSITGDITTQRGRFECGGCIHDLIAKHFPKLKHLIKWHLMNSNGPMYYIENTTYHADEHGPTRACLRDNYVNEEGLDVGVIKFMTPEKAYKIQALNPARYVVELDEKTAKEANLEAARESAIWPDATIEQLRDEEALRARLPGLIAEFKKDIEDFGFEF